MLCPVTCDQSGVDITVVGLPHDGGTACLISLRLLKRPLTLLRIGPLPWPPSQWADRCVAVLRTLFHLLTRFLFGHRAEPPTYALVEWLFIRILGLIYLIAFAS